MKITQLNQRVMATDIIKNETNKNRSKTKTSNAHGDHTDTIYSSITIRCGQIQKRIQNFNEIQKTN